MKKGIQENLNGNGLSIGIDTKWYSLLGEREVSRTLVIENIKKYQIQEEHKVNKYFDLEVKENDVVDFITIREKLVIPEGFKKELNFTEMQQLLNMQLLENGLRLDSLFQAGGCRVIKASMNFKVRNDKSKRLEEYLSKFESSQKTS